MGKSIRKQERMVFSEEKNQEIFMSAPVATAATSVGWASAHHRRSQHTPSFSKIPKAANGALRRPAKQISPRRHEKHEGFTKLRQFQKTLRFNHPPLRAVLVKTLSISPPHMRYGTRELLSFPLIFVFS
jgi:hypothetical protein